MTQHLHGRRGREVATAREHDGLPGRRRLRAHLAEGRAGVAALMDPHVGEVHAEVLLELLARGLRERRAAALGLEAGLEPQGGAMGSGRGPGRRAMGSARSA